MIYKLTENTKEVLGEIVYQIVLIEDCQYGKIGTLGGYVRDTSNLRDNAWICQNTIVSENAVICDNAVVYHFAKVYGNARISNDARIYNNAEVYGDARIYDNAEVYGDARIFDNAQIYNHAEVYNHAVVCENALVHDNAKVRKDAKISGNASIHGRSKVSGTFNTTPLQIQGTRHFFNVSEKNQICIGCNKFSIDDWLKNYKTLGMSALYSNSEIKEYKLYIDLAKALSEI